MRYEGLGEGKTKGTRWIFNGETWQKSGTWRVWGEDVRAYSGGTHVWTLKGLNKEGEKHGLIEQHIGSNPPTGSWGPAS